MFPKKGNTFPSRQDYARGVAAALQQELGSTHQAVKTLMKWTDANERTAKNWLSGTSGPRGEYLVRLVMHSDQVLAYFLLTCQRDGLTGLISLPAMRNELASALESIDRCLSLTERAGDNVRKPLKN
ncbi:hypothetical protein AO067_04315 [Pseudomonas viridiflava ICMP 13104]|uniref:Uncharacterized protein n=1 Tax=Pseudomonas viridiflava ICMP 13104 TaxID=1198305 RepID=A0A0W0IGX0_PSEVI|nr:hypothetical protein AO067_04315 [Pseudomonas viridiflava ICMP 13104]